MDAPTEIEIRDFLARERLGYQGIDLPHGLATPGHDRRQAKEIAFSGSVEGKTVLDIGSYLGAFCIEALKRGASRAVGLELNRERIRVAREIAGFLGLKPEYVRADVEDRPALGEFDIVLCLNVLHHVRDATGTLRYLATCTRERLLIEAEPPAAKKHGLGLTAAEVLNAHPVIYTGPCVPSGLNQSFFFTPSALRRILDGHMRLFQRIEEIESEFKGRFLLNCTRLRIDRMVVVAGANSAGKSTLCDQIKRNEFAHQLGISDMSDAHWFALPRIWRFPLERWFAKPHYKRALYHYDISLIDRRRLHSFRRDPASDLLLCASQLDFVIVAPTRETLKYQLMEPARNYKPKDKFYAKCLKLFDQELYLLDLYSDWIEFCAPLNGRFLLYVERDGNRVMIPCKSRDEALVEIRRLYA